MSRKKNAMRALGWQEWLRYFSTFVAPTCAEPSPRQTVSKQRLCKTFAQGFCSPQSTWQAVQVLRKKHLRKMSVLKRFTLERCCAIYVQEQQRTSPSTTTPLAPSLITTQ